MKITTLIGHLCYQHIIYLIRDTYFVLMPRRYLN